MRARLRPRVTYANVVASVCLFILLGGGAYAASSLIGRDGQIHGCVARSGALIVVKHGKRCPRHQTAIAWNQRGRKGDQGRPGRDGQNGTNGINGVNGVNGVNGATNVIARNKTLNVAGVAAGASQTVNIGCDSGEVATGGGVNVDVLSPGPGDSESKATIFQDFPTHNGAHQFSPPVAPNGWTVGVKNNNASSTVFGSAWVVCASP